MSVPARRLADRHADLLARCTFPGPGERLVCGVSGGADSLALLVLAVAADCVVTAVHVDHGIRPESSVEAVFVAEVAARFGVAFRSESLTIAPGPNLEARARLAAEPHARVAAGERVAARLVAPRRPVVRRPARGLACAMLAAHVALRRARIAYLGTWEGARSVRASRLADGGGAWRVLLHCRMRNFSARPAICARRRAAVRAAG